MSAPNQQNLFAFQGDLEKFARQIDVNVGTVVRKVVLDLHSKIIMRTPVDTGRARASWGIAADKMPPTVAPPRAAGTGNAASATAEAKKSQSIVKAANPKAMAYRTWWIFNNLPYIVSLEYGSSRQAPAGMVRVSLAEIELEIARMMLK